MTTINEPSILTANCYFWKPGGSASQRRYNEDRRRAEVYRYFEAIGFQPECKHLVHGPISVYFWYEESCKNVYRSLEITRDGKKSNIVGLRGYIAKMGTVTKEEQLARGMSPEVR